MRMLDFIFGDDILFCTYEFCYKETHNKASVGITYAVSDGRLKGDFFVFNCFMRCSLTIEEAEKRKRNK